MPCSRWVRGNCAHAHGSINPPPNCVSFLPSPATAARRISYIALKFIKAARRPTTRPAQHSNGRGRTARSRSPSAGPPVTVIVKLVVAWPVKFMQPFCLLGSPPFDGLLSYRADPDSTEPPRRVASFAWGHPSVEDNAVWPPHIRGYGCAAVLHPDRHAAVPASRSQSHYGDVRGCTATEEMAQSWSIRRRRMA